MNLARPRQLLMYAFWPLALILATPVVGAAAVEPFEGPGYRSQAVQLPASGRTFLQRLPPATTGITFTNFLSEEKSLENSLLASGSGVAAGDVDGDGWCDLYFCRMEGPNVLYRNLGGWKFEDITATAGVACNGQFSTGTVLADVDGDGDLDLLVTAAGGARLFLNDGKAHFTEAKDAGLVRRFGATSMALADLDGNGTLDLYVCNYAVTKIEDHPNSRFDSKVINGKTVLTAINGVPMTSPDLTNRYFVDNERIVRERGEPDILYFNDGHGRFKAVSWTDGTFLDEDGKPLTQPPYDFGLSVMLRDIDGDRLPDIYVCNDLFPPDRIWINDGRGRFRALSNLAVRNTCRFSMGVDFADLNRDGHDEFFVVDMLSREHARRKVQTVGVPPFLLPVGLIDNRPQYKRNSLYLNRGDGTYAEISALAGLDATEWSWMPAFLDVDLDGYEDVLVTTGYHRDSLHMDAVNQILAQRRGRRLSDLDHRALKQHFYPGLTRANQAFHNRGDLTFADTAREWGFDYVGETHGLCLADLDNDGDLDVIVSHLNDCAGLYRNESIAPRVAVRLRGRAPNTRAIGARIQFLGGPMPQSQEIMSGGRYLSSDDTIRMFAAGRGTNGLRLEVAWRNGAVSVVSNVQPNRIYDIDERSAHAAPNSKLETRNSKLPWFTDVSSLLNHTNVDEGFNDFEAQPLMPRRLSQQAPGVCWQDLDGDGWEELILGTGAGGRMAAFQNDGKGAFRPWPGPQLDQVLQRDQTTILGWRKSDGQTVLLAGSSNYEDASTKETCVRQFDLARRSVDDSLPGLPASVGPMALADVDGDGLLDLFVGGRVLPQMYPAPASSALFRQSGGKFIPDGENTKGLAQVGLVHGAVFSDLNGDGWPELILACEWGPLKIFRNDKGKLVPWDPPVAAAQSQLSTLSQLTGWWNGITTGDFDGDGRLDIVAGNWGRNLKHEGFRRRPLQIYFGEWRVPGAMDQMDAYYDEGLKKIVPWCSYETAKKLPWIAERYPTATAFSTAGVAELLAEHTNATRVLQAVWLETTVFLNRGDRFEAAPLPLEAQFSPAFGVCVADANGDGREDIFLSQNFSAMDGDTPRCDAGRGLWLAGDGAGKFRPVPGQESGVRVYGEQRGCALADYDGDGRVDLVVSQNGAETKLYRNTGAKPGLRVRLRGPAGNPDAVGAVLRLKFASGWGPAREIHAGSGYWSQDSACAVLGTPSPPNAIQIAWPGGRRTEQTLNQSGGEVIVKP